MSKLVEETRFRVTKRFKTESGRMLEVDDIVDISEVYPGFHGESRYKLEGEEVVNAKDFNDCTEDITVMVKPRKPGKWEV